MSYWVAFFEKEAAVYTLKSVNARHINDDVHHVGTQFVQGHIHGLAVSRNVDLVQQKRASCQVIVTPHDTTRVTMGAVLLQTDSDIPKFKKKMLFFSVSPERKKASSR